MYAIDMRLVNSRESIVPTATQPSEEKRKNEELTETPYASATYKPYPYKPL